MTLMRGLADDLPLMEWLNRAHLAGGSASTCRRSSCYDGTLLACAEMIRGGVTCFNDMYFFPEQAARAVLAAGMRAALGIICIEFPTAYASDAQDYLHKGLAARDALKHEPLLSFCIAPHAPYTVSDRSFEQIATYAEELQIADAHPPARDRGRDPREPDALRAAPAGALAASRAARPRTDRGARRAPASPQEIALLRRPAATSRTAPAPI